MKKRNVQFTPMEPRNGLIGFVAIYYHDILIQNIGVYTQLKGVSRIRLTFPVKKLKNGNLIELVKPLSLVAYSSFVKQVEDHLYEIGFWEREDEL